MDATLKQRYPFRLGTTSFIYRADYVTNVERLAPYVDEIELLFFESDHLPSRRDIVELDALAMAHGITYNVHLPMDVDPSADSRQERKQSINALAKSIERVAPLKPTTHTLHIPYNRSDRKQGSIEAWQACAIKGLGALLQTSGVPSRCISIENLDFSPSWIMPIMEAMDTAACVDVGHAVLYGYGLKETLDMFTPRTTLIHLHGIADGADHRSLLQLAPHHGRTISRYLNEFDASVSLEVFSLQNLTESMACFPDLMALANNAGQA